MKCSGGQQQRVAIARGLIHQPDILLTVYVQDHPLNAHEDILEHILKKYVFSLSPLILLIQNRNL